jgi:hypothetical protein
MTNDYHTGIELFSYEITISPRGGIGAESTRIVKARARGDYETHDTFMDHLQDLAVNAGLMLAQQTVKSYAKRL